MVTIFYQITMIFSRNCYFWLILFLGTGLYASLDNEQHLLHNYS